MRTGQLIILIVSLYWGIYLRFTNPQLTESQLFLNNWQLIFPLFIGFGIEYFRRKKLL